MTSCFYRTFAWVALLPYVGGTVFHGLRLARRFTAEEMPYPVDWVVVVVGGYATAGFIRFARTVRFTGMRDRILYGLVIVHLGLSAVVHAWSLATGNHDWVTAFPLGYSWFALFYFVGLGLYCLTLGRRIAREAPRA